MTQQPTYRKVKMKISQPDIMCHARKNIDCFYRGKVVSEDEFSMVIEFKTEGKKVREKYDKKLQEFENPLYRDIKII
jgi:hypothetical protein